MSRSLDQGRLPGFPNLNGRFVFTREANLSLGGAGSRPAGGVVFGSAGTLFGTTLFGTTLGDDSANGTAYKLTPPSAQGDPWTQTVIPDFTGLQDGGRPTYNLLPLGGAFLGTTSGPSAVFEVTQ